MFLCVYVVKNELYELTEEEIKVVEGKKQKLVAKHRILCKPQQNKKTAAAVAVILLIMRIIIKRQINIITA